MSLPPYNDQGFVQSLPILPPFLLQGMNTRVLPLRANLAALQRVVDSLLDIVPPQTARFRVQLPYVYVLMLDYGKLAAPIANLGWLGQQEVMFGIPVSRYAWRDGAWHFVCMGWATPYMFVDSDQALAFGRQVYGWPKLRFQRSCRPSDWLRDAYAPDPKLTLRTEVFQEMYAGQDPVNRPFIEVYDEADVLRFQWPLDPKSPVAPWNIAENLASAAVSSAEDLRNTLRAMGLAPPNDFTSPASIEATMWFVANQLDPMGHGPSFHTYNLKQFRLASDPKRYCYQSLTEGAMVVQDFQGGGLLGVDRLAVGDTSGGYTVKIYEWDSLPIVETLQLEADSTGRAHGAAYACCKPVMPFWYEVDMVYRRGVNLAWRGPDRVWHAEDGQRYLRPPGPYGEAFNELVDGLFNTTLGPAEQSISGPFDFLGGALVISLLAADRQRLQAFIDDYLNEPAQGTDLAYALWTPPGDHDPHCAFVLLMLTDFGTTTSATNDIGNWATQDARFCVPVVRADNVGAAVPDALVPTFSFAANTTMAITFSEVSGIPTNKAVFVNPENNELFDTHTPPVLLKVRTEVMPALSEGQKVVERTVLSVCDGGIDRRRGRPLLAAKKAAGDEASSALDSVVRQWFGGWERGERELCYISLKQFRDVHVPTAACYQAFVRTCYEPRTGTDVDLRLGVRQLDDIFLHLTEYPSLPIIATLGLQTAMTPVQGRGVRHRVDPVATVRVERLSWRQKLGETLWYRTGMEWRRGPDAAPGLKLSLAELDEEG